MGSSGKSSKKDREMFRVFNFLLTILLSVDTTLARYTHSSCFLGDTVFNRGHSIAQRNLASPQICQEWCQLVRRCTHFSYNTGTSTCFLRDGSRTETMRGYISGPKSCQAPPVPKSCNSTDEPICLVGGSSEREGNLLVGNRPVCDDLWSLEDATVACRQLGFPGAIRATIESAFGEMHSINYTMDRVRCYGNETDLADCYHMSRHACDVGEAAGVVCAEEGWVLPQHCNEEGRLCLAGGSEPSAGNVYLGGHPVCHNGWDYPDATVVCRALGFPGAVDFTIRSQFGPALSFFKMSQVDCRGDEDGLLACPHTYTTGGCDTDTVAGVHCLDTPRQEAASKVAFLVLGMALALLLTVSGLGIFYLRTRGKTVSSMSSLSFASPIRNIVRMPVESTTHEAENANYSDLYMSTAALCDK